MRIQSISKYIRDKYRYDKTLTTWDDKRTRISIRRNDIEIKLRNLVGMQMQMKYGKKAKEQLITIIKKTTNDASQEVKLLAFDFKKALQEIYFSQIKLIMLKFWQDYERIFPERVKFEQFFDIINKCRVDAHAKELNDEDEAILTLAFKYFETALVDI